MWPRKLFLIVRAVDWEVARKRVLLTRRRLGCAKNLRCYTPTTIGERIAQAPRDSVLLRIDPSRTRLGMARGLGFVNLYGDLPVAAVDAVYALPLASAGAFGLPSDCDEYYKGQRIKDLADAVASVPTTAEAEQYILQALDEFHRDPSIPACDVAAAIEDVCSRLEWESISEEVAEQVTAWQRALEKGGKQD